MEIQIDEVQMRNKEYKSGADLEKENALYCKKSLQFLKVCF